MTRYVWAWYTQVNWRAAKPEDHGSYTAAHASHHASHPACSSSTRASVYSSVALVSTPAVGACIALSCVHLRHSRANCGTSAQTRQGLRRSWCSQPGLRLCNPNMQPSKSYNDRLKLRIKRCTERSRQYEQWRGHSRATLPPLARQAIAARTKLRQRTRKILLCSLIFACVAGPRDQFRFTYGDPPVQGRDPRRSVGTLGLVTAATALARPASVVRSSSMVNRITSQSGDARRPTRESAPQQNSTIRLR